MFVKYAIRGNMVSQKRTSRLSTVCYTARVIFSAFPPFHKRAVGLRLETIIHLSHAQSISILLLSYHAVKVYYAVYLDVPKRNSICLLF